MVANRSLFHAKIIAKLVRKIVMHTKTNTKLRNQQTMFGT